MVAVYAVLILSLTFIFIFINQIFSTIFFILRKNPPIVQAVTKKNNKKAIIKNKLSILLAKKKIKLQSRNFYAKFLNERGYSKLPISIRFLIDEIYFRLCVNTKYLNCYVDYDKLKNAGIFNENPIFKIEVKDKKSLEKYLIALNEVYKYIQFRAIFLLDENNENEAIIDAINQSNIDHKIILMKDINIKLLQEINKLNLNFKTEKIIDINSLKNDFSFNNITFNIKENLNFEEYLSKKDEVHIKLIKFLNLFNNSFEESTVCYYLNIFNNNEKNKIIKFSLNYRLKNEFFNVSIKENKIFIDYFSKNCKKEVFHFSNGLQDYEILKNNGKIFIKFNFIISSQSKSKETFVFIAVENQATEIDKQEILRLIYDNNFNISRCFNLKIYIKNNDFNDLFNNKLKKLIIEERLSENKLKKNFILPNSIVQLFIKFFKFDYKSLIQISSYYDLYKTIIKEIFGIYIKDNLIYINPCKKYYNQNFKLIFVNDGGYSSLYVDQNSDFQGLEVEGVIYSNLKVVDINLISNNAKLCI